MSYESFAKENSIGRHVITFKVRYNGKGNENNHKFLSMDQVYTVIEIYVSKLYTSVTLLEVQGEYCYEFFDEFVEEIQDSKKTAILGEISTEPFVGKQMKVIMNNSLTHCTTGTISAITKVGLNGYILYTESNIYMVTL